MPSPNNHRQLCQLVHLLSQGSFVTTAQIALESRCPKSVVKRRLQRLKEAGCTLETIRVREGVSGPKSVAYALIPNDASKTFRHRR